MKKSFIAALALSVSLSFAAGAAAAAEQTLAQKHQGMWPKSENGFVNSESPQNLRELCGIDAAHIAARAREALNIG